MNPSENGSWMAVESRDVQRMFLSRSTERQAGDHRKTVVIDWFYEELN